MKLSKTLLKLLLIFFQLCAFSFGTSATTTTAPIAETSTTVEAVVDAEVLDEHGPGTNSSGLDPGSGKDSGFRSGRDLVYEAMKMRSGNWKPRSPDDEVKRQISQRLAQDL